jgi:hypothetical protein
MSLVAAGIAGGVANLIGGAISINEISKSKKALQQLEKERPGIGVPKELYDGFKASEDERQFSREGADRNMSSAAGAMLRDPRMAGNMQGMVDQNQQMLKEAGINKYLRDQQINQAIASQKARNQEIKLDNWQKAVGMANERRVGGIQSLHESIGGVAKNIPFMFGKEGFPTDK